MTYLAAFGSLGPLEIILILSIIILIFGVGKLPQVGGSLGRAIREFRSSVREGNEEPPSSPPELPEVTARKDEQP